MPFKQVRLSFILVTGLCLGLLDVQAAPRRTRASQKANTASTTCAAKLVPTSLSSDQPQGILKHGEHWVDLIFAQAGQSDPRAGRAFTQLAQDLLTQIAQGQMRVVNEKIDGSPSVVLGFTPDGAPFLTYKGDLSGKKQRLVTATNGLATKFGGKLQNLYSTGIAEISPRMAPLNSELGDYIFQGDVLFVEEPALAEKQARGPPSDNDADLESADSEGAEKKRITRSDDQIVIQANSLPYTIHKNHPLFSGLQTARFGLVIHSVGKRVVDPTTGLLRVEPLSQAQEQDQEFKRRLVQKLVQKLQSPTLFVAHPWSTQVPLSQLTHRQVEMLWSSVGSRLVRIQSLLQSLTPEFRTRWSSAFEAQFRVYFNGFLRPPSHGGFFKEARDGKPLEIERWIRRFRGFIAERAKKELITPALEKELEQALAPGSAGRAGIDAVIEAFDHAVRIHYVLQPHLELALRSKLGGGTVEGLMLETSDTIVKFVDRLGFTLRNNAVWNRAVGTSDLTDIGNGANPAPALIAPFDRFGQDGAAVLLLKGQPVHSGHIRMIQQAAMQAKARGTELHVIVSDKEPNLDARHWSELKITDTKKDLERRSYTYLFDVALKRRILEAGLRKELRNGTVTLHFTQPVWLKRILAAAPRNAELPKIWLVMGQKEMDQARYDDLLESYPERLRPMIVPMQEGGISATQVRRALRDSVLGDAETQKTAQITLDQAYSAIGNKRVRSQLVRAISARWAEVDAVARRILER